MNISPYIFFSSGKCREAFSFYQQVLGGELRLFTGADMPDSDNVPVEMSDLVMHASLATHGQTLMGSDDPTGNDGPKSGLTVSLSHEDPDFIKTTFASFSDGGTVTMPLAATSWALQFGMCVDRFGTPWMLSAEAPEQPNPE